MTPKPCPECRHRNGHKMSCDTGYRQRTRARLATEYFEVDTPPTTVPIIETPAQETCAPPTSADTSGACGGGAE